jgi:hypothetical protein
MQTIDTRPQSVAIQHYAGDTLILNITTASDYSTATWAGQIRLNHADATPDATFSIVPDTIGAVATLSATDSAALNDLGVEVTEGGQTFKRYSGIFDIQIVEGAIVNTLVRGTITVDSDVTKVV